MIKATEEQAFAWRVKNDFYWFAKNFLKIRNKQSKLVPFVFNDAQNEFLKKIEEDKKKGKPLRYIILKARQLGFSTFTEGYIYWNTSTNEFKDSLIIAHEEKATQNLFTMSKLFYDVSLPIIQPMKKYSNDKALVFENPTNSQSEKLANPGLRSKITVATAGTSDTARSGTYHNVHTSEIAFFPNPKNTMTALLQCVPEDSNTLVVMESTANGVGGYFYDMWNDAVNGKNDFTPLFFPWFTDKEYSTKFDTDEERQAFIDDVNLIVKGDDGKDLHTDEYWLMKKHSLTYEQLNWRKKAIANKCGGDIHMFHQEYPSTPEEAFIVSGRPRFNIPALREYEANCIPPIFKGFVNKSGSKIILEENPEGDFEIWERPNTNYSYYIGADSAEGLETGDYSTAVVMDSNLKVVAKYKGHLDPDLFGILLNDVAIYYNDAYIVPESNNHGLTAIKALLRCDNYNIFRTKIYDKYTDTYTAKLGWSTTRKTKPLMIDKLAEYIREKFIILQDLDIVGEMYTYMLDAKGGTNAVQGKHDDLVIALALALQGTLENLGGEYIPELPPDGKTTKKNIDIDVPEIIDPEFESEGSLEEYER